MKISEFRIGISVYLDDLDIDTGKWHQRVFEITYRDIYNIINGNDMVKGAYEGIPLTEEWIKKLGFENSKTQDKFFTKDNSIGISTADNKFRFIQGNFVCQLVLREIEFVHELQNLYYAITGVELSVS